MEISPNGRVAAVGLGLSLVVGLLADRTKRAEAQMEAEASHLSPASQEMRDYYKRMYTATCEDILTEALLDGLDGDKANQDTRDLYLYKSRMTSLYEKEGLKGKAEDWQCLPGFTEKGGIPKFE